MAEQKRVVNGRHYRRETPLSRDFAPLVLFCFVFSFNWESPNFPALGIATEDSGESRARRAPEARSERLATRGQHHPRRRRVPRPPRRRSAKQRGCQREPATRGGWAPLGGQKPGLKTVGFDTGAGQMWRAGPPARPPRQTVPARYHLALKITWKRKSRYLYPCGMLRGVWKESGWVWSWKQGPPSLAVGKFWH